jgi:hypothetical protein
MTIYPSSGFFLGPSRPLQHHCRCCRESLRSPAPWRQKSEILDLKGLTFVNHIKLLIIKPDIYGETIVKTVLLPKIKSCEAINHVLLGRGSAIFYAGVPVLVGFSGSSLGYMNDDCRIARFLKGKGQGEHVTII